MRLVKLSTEEFSDTKAIDDFFDDKLPKRNPPGQFGITKGWISSDGLSLSEWILFSFKGHVVRLAQTASERLPNLDDERSVYPHYFVVDMATVRKVDFLVADLERELQLHCGETKSISASRGWVILPDTETALNIVKRLGGFSVD